MNQNIDYYDRNARGFFDSTVAVDMSTLHEAFLAKLPRKARILDAGCGSGRDAKIFAAAGHDVSAFDASAELAALASQYCGIDVEVRSFADIEERDFYDGIWCCASLLHVPIAEIEACFARLWQALRVDGCLYVSFKLGTGAREHGGRHFTDVTDAILRSWLSGLGQIASIHTWVTEDQRPDRHEQWINGLVVRAGAPKPKLITGGDDPFLPHLSREMARASTVEIAVAFTTTKGIQLLLPDLRDVLKASGETGSAVRTVKVLTSDYLDVTDPEALRQLLLLKAEGAQVKVYATPRGTSFHLKAYIFAFEEGERLIHGAAFVGSSNISRQALQHGLEWNYCARFPEDDGFKEARTRFTKLFEHAHAVELTNAWIESYEKRRVVPPRSAVPGTGVPDEKDPPPLPTAIQLEALDALAASRADGYRRGLVVLATGLGKTWLAAFDATRMGARRVLFVAHREEILNQAAETFIRIRPGSRVGLYLGQSHDAEVDVLCASVQTLARAKHLERFAPQHFDYVVVDEFHHAAASTYQRLLAYFAPAFLLGLTATPDRTDQSDILSLCDNNLVFTSDLFQGIQAELLSPFHYFGILDESVDYREVPWRNGKFDPEQLSNKLATLARARHALKEWHARAQKRTLGFCVSIKHAEYMAAQFARAGVAAAAVYAGSAIGRAQALEQLRDGQLSVIFSVDLFNEGVDLPSIDTVMMLRPTESKIMFLQQLGRGLRRSADKQHLVVLDFIGNHRSFLQKPQALFGVGTSYAALAGFARKVQAGRLELPKACYVNYDLGIIEFLKSLDVAGAEKEYEALRDSLGRRPTLAEFFRSGASVQAMRRQHESWFDLVKAMGDLDPDEVRVVEALADTLREVEVTAMTKSFKMVLLEAWIELNGLESAPLLSALNERSWEVLHRKVDLLDELPDDIASLSNGKGEQWSRYWLDNPVKAWTKGDRASPGKAWFRVDSGRFASTQSVPVAVVAVASNLLLELVAYRLAAYGARRAADATVSNVIAFKPRPRVGVELPYFPNLKIACGHFRVGRTDAEEHRALPAAYGKLDPQRHFIARASGNSMDGGKSPIRDGDYLLLELVTPGNAGSITGSTMAIERQDEAGGDNQYLLRVVTKARDGSYVLRANNPAYDDLQASDEMRTLARFKAIVDPLDLAVGQVFEREDIPPMFGELFNPGSWNVGHVVLNRQKAHILLVTLNKQGRAAELRFHDHWIDDETFHWQTQNATTPESKRGQELIKHVALGFSIHLFVREDKLSKGKAAPFVYHGQVAYRSHTGRAPMSVVLGLLA